MVMPWFLPLALGIGLLATKTAIEEKRTTFKSPRHGSIWLLLSIGWFPLLIWFINNLLPQY